MNRKIFTNAKFVFAFLLSLPSILLIGKTSELPTTSIQPYHFSMADTTAAPGGQICIEITAQNFTNITSFQFAIQYDPEVLSFVPNSASSSILEPVLIGSLPTSGIPFVGISWSPLVTLSPATIPDGVPLFQVCFDAIGEAGDCSELNFANLGNDPLFGNPELTTDFSNIFGEEDLIFTDGSICLVGVELYPEFSNMTSDCSTANTGGFSVLIPNGVPPFELFIQDSMDSSSVIMGPILINNHNISTIANIEAGNHQISISDSAQPPFTYEGEITIMQGPDLEANIIVEQLPNCMENGEISMEVFVDTLLTDIDSLEYNITWTLDNQVIDHTGFTNFDMLTPGIVGVTIEHIASGCSIYEEIEIQEDPDFLLPLVEAGEDTVIDCNQTEVMLMGNDFEIGTSYFWTGPGIVSGDSTLNPIVNQAGTYTLTVISASGCMIIDEVTILEDMEVPIIDMGNSVLFACEPLNISFTFPPSDFYVCYWIGDNLADTIHTCELFVEESGIYTLTLEGTNGCTSSADMEIDIIELESTSTTTPDTFEGNGTAEVFPTGGSFYNYLWSNGQTTAFIENLEAGTYTVTITDDNGCIIETEVVVESLTSLEELDVNYTFEIFPNPSQGQFFIQLNFDQKEAGELQIYNLLGEKVYSKSYNTKKIKEEIDLSNYKSGAYLITWNSAQLVVTKKVLIIQ